MELRYEVRRHRMPSYEVRCSDMECRGAATKSAASTGNVVVQQRSPLHRQGMSSCSNEVRAAEQQRHRMPSYEKFHQLRNPSAARHEVPQRPRTHLTGALRYVPRHEMPLQWTMDCGTSFRCSGIKCRKVHDSGASFPESSISSTKFYAVRSTVGMECRKFPTKEGSGGSFVKLFDVHTLSADLTQSQTGNRFILTLRSD
jgi:hypothetical protein